MSSIDKVRMMDITTLSVIAGSITLLSTLIIIFVMHLRKKYKRTNIWQTSMHIQSTTNSAPISRRTSTSCLINLEKPIHHQSRSRSASFSEDLTARLQILAAGHSYRSYTPAIINSTPRSGRPSLNTNIRLPSVTSTIPAKTTIPSITFQLRYEQTIENLFITIFQLENYISVKTTQHVFLILYLLPNDDEQHQSQSSINGIFNEHFQFPLKSDDLSKRTLRITAYTVDSITRIRNILGHLFIKFDSYIIENNIDRTFSTSILTECLKQDLSIRSDYLGELILTSIYLKDENFIQIHIQQINHLQIDSSKRTDLLKAYFTGQISNNLEKSPWINTSTFLIPTTSSFILDQNFKLNIQPMIISHHENQHFDCHLRLHIHGWKQVHSHARWQQSFRSNSSQIFTVPLFNL